MSFSVIRISQKHSVFISVTADYAVLIGMIFVGSGILVEICFCRVTSVKMIFLVPDVLSLISVIPGAVGRKNNKTANIRGRKIRGRFLHAEQYCSFPTKG